MPRPASASMSGEDDHAARGRVVAPVGASSTLPAGGSVPEGPSAPAGAHGVVADTACGHRATGRGRAIVSGSSFVERIAVNTGTASVLALPADWQARRERLVRTCPLSPDQLRLSKGRATESDAEALTAAWTPDAVRTMSRSQNESLVDAELRDEHEFFERIEKTPLTEEQSRAVICFDNRVQLVAAAGSGKTSTTVAKAGWTIRKGIARADEVLLLAFNRAAAEELARGFHPQLFGGPC